MHYFFLNSSQDPPLVGGSNCTVAFLLRPPPLWGGHCGARAAFLLPFFLPSDAPPFKGGPCLNG